MYAWRFEDKKWRQHIGMTFKFFNKLLRKLKQDPELRCRRADMTPLKKQLVVVLHIMRSGCSAASIETQAGVGQSTICGWKQKICRALGRLKRFAGIYLPQTVDELEPLASVNGHYKRSQMPNCVGAVDGTHVPYATENLAYHNCKKFHSLNMQAIVDPNGMFRDLFDQCPIPGSWSDKRVYDWSDARHWVKNISKMSVKMISGMPVGLYIAADGGYGQLPRPGLQVPYVPADTTWKKRYNFHHSSARMIVEQAFGALKGRWRILLVTHIHKFNPDAIVDLFVACAVLHNLLLIDGDHVARRDIVPHGEGCRWEVLNCADATTVAAPPLSELDQGVAERVAIARHVIETHYGDDPVAAIVHPIEYDVGMGPDDDE
jgi:hypothetical protein